MAYQYRHFISSTTIIVLTALVVGLYQNCGATFKTASNSDQDPSRGGNNHAPAPPLATDINGNPIMPAEPPVDPQGPLQIYVRNATSIQGGQLAFTVEINKAHDQAITAQLETRNESASAGVDYEAYSGTITISPGQLTSTVNVQTWAYAIAPAFLQVSLVALSRTAGGLAKPLGIGAITVPYKQVDVHSVSAGQSHSCALTTSGEVSCWGSNNFGQLGDNTYVSSASPVNVFTLSGAKKLAIGSSHSCAITATDTVKCWTGNSG